MLTVLSNYVFRCFRKFERTFDRVTARVGPVFVTFCTGLLILGIITYFDVYYPAIFLQPGSGWLMTLAGTAWSIYVIVCFSAHYYFAVTILPGSPNDPPGTLRTRPFFTWRAKPNITSCQTAQQQHSRSERNTALMVPRDSESTVLDRRCRKCPAGTDGQPVKPDRAHHCSVCQTCWLKFDHHCPWINGCVGLNNERYFFLFMVYICLACISVTFLGFSTMLNSLDFGEDWPHYTPRAFTALVWILSVAMGFALSVMALWQLWLIARGESTVESHDNDYYRKLAKHRSKIFRNPYDLGWMENIRYFFNVGEGRHQYYTVFVPLRVSAASDGWSWRKRHNWQDTGVTAADELTDDEGDMSE